MPHQCTGCGHVFPDGSKEMLSGCPDCGGNKFQFKPGGVDDAPATDAGDGSAGGTAGTGPADEGTQQSPEPPDPPSPGGGVAETVAGAAQSVRSMVGGSDDAREWPAVGREPADRPDGPAEDAAQASARSGTVSPDELPDHDRSPDPDDEPSTDEEGESYAPEITAPGRTTGEGPGAEDEPLEDSPEAEDVPDEEPSAPEEPAAGEADEPGKTPFTGAGAAEREDDSPDLSELRAELNDQFESIKIVERGQYELNLMELYDREEYIISLMEDGRYAIEVPETWRGNA